MDVRRTAQEHPNATVAIVTTGPAALIVWLLGFLVALPDYVAASIAGFVISLVLAWGRYGLFGLWQRFLHGSDAPPR